MASFETRHNSPEFKVLPPLPSEQHERPSVTLADLPAGKYVDTIARVASLKVKEVEDELGSKPIFSGVFEDSTFKVPFLCHKVSLPLEKNLVLRIRSAYVHEFEDRSLLLVLTEYTGAEPRYSEDIMEYVWFPRIGQICRPVWNLTLKGTVSNVYGSSGLVKRCNKCKAVIYEKCLNGCEEGWDWDVRVSANLFDGTGSIKMILGRFLASRLLQRNLSEVFFLAKAQNVPSPEGFDVLSFDLEVPELDVVEAVVEDPLKYRHHDCLIVSDGNTRIYYPPNITIDNCVKTSVRKLALNNAEDSMILRRFIEKALSIRINQITGKPYVHGIHLLEKPISLYHSEKAHLYLGFSTSVKVVDGKVAVEASPQAYVRESVWDYIQWRRSRGASASAIEKTILKHRTNVVLAPFGHFGRVEELVFKKAGGERVSEMDDRSFVQFWREVYDIDVDPNETPLLRVRLMKFDIPLTYPPSCVYFDRNALFLTAGAQHYIEMKRLPLKMRTQAVMSKALSSLSIGDVELKSLGENGQRVDVQRLLLYEIQQKLLGRTVEARGNITQLKDRFYFFPHTVMKVN